MRMMMVATVAAVALAGCSTGQDLAMTDIAVKNFHSQLDAGQFAEIQAASGPEMKGPEVITLFDTVHSQMGAVKSSAREGFSNNYNNGDHTVTVTYATVFESGPKTETFIFRMLTGAPKLIGYQIK